MRGLFRTTFLFFIVALFLVSSSGSYAQGTGRSLARRLITSIRLDKPNNEFFGTLYASVNGAETQIADSVINAWVIEGGQRLVYSKRDGSGGYENEGESLRVYDPQTDRTLKAMSQYYAVHDLTEVRTASGKTALLVTMTDGGLGAFYLSVVDPSRGEVFFRRFARLLSRRGETARVGSYARDIDWTQFYDNQTPKARPHRTETINLSAILRRPVIFNKPQRR